MQLVFLQDSRVQHNLDKPTAYDLIASHGNMEDLTFFASLIQDYERVIAHYVQSGQYTKALELLESPRRRRRRERPATMRA